MITPLVHCTPLPIKKKVEDTCPICIQSLQACPTLCDLWTVAHQAPPSMGFSRQEYWSGLPFPTTSKKPAFFLLPSEPHTKGCAHHSEACAWLILPCDIVAVVTQRSHFTMSNDDKHICDSSHIVLPSPCSGLPAALPVCPLAGNTTTLLCSSFSHGHIPLPSTDSAPWRLRLQLM